MSAAATNPIRVLLVDDHSLFRAGLRLIIERLPGMELVGDAGNRTEALAKAGLENPDIILLDIDLGGENGLDLIPELLEAAVNARIIMITGSRDPEAYRQAVLRGAMGVVPKEKAAEVLIKAIERVKAGEAWLDPVTVASLLSEITARNKPKAVSPEEAKIATLTKREREVVSLVGEGIKSREIADRLFISETTVRHHLTSIFDKLGVADRVELMLYAYRHELANPPQ
jgi:two-component system nitrate/nitrite response regulator NarL